MATKYNPSAAFDKMFLSKKPKENAVEEKKKNSSKVKSSGSGGRPAKIDEDVYKRSYYLTQKHIDCLAKYCADNSTDLSSAVREAVESLCKKNGTW